ncbi:acylphosphatase [Virgibacillus ainsalahensis]
MTAQFPNILTPKMTEGIKSFNLCTFLIGLEGWRRGLTLTYYGDINQYSDIHTQGKKIMGRNYSLTSDDKIHYFNQSRGDRVSNEAVKVAQSKQKTKDCLIKHKIPLMPSLEFDRSHTDEDIIKEGRQIGFPIIIKPTYGSLSKGVMLNIQNETELAKSLKYVRKTLGYKSVILEKYFEGDDIRLYVVDGVAVAALRREPAKVTGNGKDTIEELIKQKNESRKDNPYLAARLIKIDEEVHEVLNKSNYQLQDVLEDGKTILVKNKSTMDQGVDLYDITDEIQDHIKQTAVDTLAALPDIIHGSIDMLYDGKEAIVLEVNASANISMHMFPTEGQPRNIGEYLMDFYFPETKGKSLAHSNMYFDFLNIVDMLKQNYTNFVEVKSLPDTPIHGKKYIISGKVQKVGYRSWIRKKATVWELHGYAKNLANGDVEVVVASEDEEKVKKFKKMCARGPKKAKVKEVKNYSWNKEIKMGFELEQSRNNEKAKLKKVEHEVETLKNNMEHIQSEYNKLKKEYNDLQKQKAYYEKEYKGMENSMSWRITKPVRKIKGSITKKR